jgi:hypothetical protein
MKAKMEEIWGIITTAKEEGTGRVRSKLFMRLPSKKLYPDYYHIISQPIGLTRIRQFIEKGKYAGNPALFKADFLLMFDNAQQYNQPESQVFADAVALQQLFLQEYANKFEKPEPSPAPPQQEQQEQDEAPPTNPNEHDHPQNNSHQNETDPPHNEVTNGADAPDGQAQGISGAGTSDNGTSAKASVKERKSKREKKKRKTTKEGRGGSASAAAGSSSRRRRKRVPDEEEEEDKDKETEKQQQPKEKAEEEVILEEVVVEETEED